MIDDLGFMNEEAGCSGASMTVAILKRSVVASFAKTRTRRESQGIAAAPTKGKAGQQNELRGGAPPPASGLPPPASRLPPPQVGSAGDGVEGAPDDVGVGHGAAESEDLPANALKEMGNH